MQLLFSSFKNTHLGERLKVNGERPVINSRGRSTKFTIKNIILAGRNIPGQLARHALSQSKLLSLS